MKQLIGTQGLVFNEGLLWESGKKGRCGISLPERDVDSFPVETELTADGPDFPELSEVEVVRHYTRLSQWNFCLDSGMYPLGSCTMKYNPKTNEKQAALPGFSGLHPLVPEPMCQGALRIMHELESYLAEITGLDCVTLQPAAGAQGELTGMLVVSAYHRARGETRSKIIIPDTAHGTNPASAALCGYTPVHVASGENGILNPQAISDVMDDDTAGIMVTNPNTLGLFEEHIREISNIVHSKGGLVYCDGANMNAAIGIVDMKKSGIDILHLNLHKTFSTPHGGGGPGAGPVCVVRELEPFLPVPRIIKDGDNYSLDGNKPDSIGKVHAFYGNFGVLIKALSYILSLGDSLKQVSEYAVLNARYIQENLKETLHLAYDRPCMHECVFTDRFQQPYKISTLDMVKRLMDYGFHPPTIYFPLVVKGAIMIEPTETETKEEIDRFIEAFKRISKEAVETPEVLKTAPLFARSSRLDETFAARNPCLCG